jgi:hypothetical protein
MQPQPKKESTMGYTAYQAVTARNTELRRRADAARVAALALPRDEEPRPEWTGRRAALLRTLRPSRAA